MTGVLALAIAFALASCRRDGPPSPSANGSADATPLPSASDSSVFDVPPPMIPDAAVSAPFMTRWPNNASDSRRAVLLLHGGGGPRLFIDHADYRRYPEALADAGYHVFMPHLVGCGSQCTALTHAALASIAADRNVRRDQVGVIGFSAGAFRAFSVVADAPASLPKVTGVVALYGGLPEPMVQTKSFPPTLVLHGDHDNLVPVANAREIERWLKGLGTEVTVHIYPEQKHGFTGAALADSIKTTVTFMQGHVAVAR